MTNLCPLNADGVHLEFIYSAGFVETSVFGPDPRLARLAATVAALIHQGSCSSGSGIAIAIAIGHNNSSFLSRGPTSFA